MCQIWDERCEVWDVRCGVGCKVWDVCYNRCWSIGTISFIYSQSSGQHLSTVSGLTCSWRKWPRCVTRTANIFPSSTDLQTVWTVYKPGDSLDSLQSTVSSPSHTRLIVILTEFGDNWKSAGFTQGYVKYYMKCIIYYQIYPVNLMYKC